MGRADIVASIARCAETWGALVCSTGPVALDRFGTLTLAGTIRRGRFLLEIGADQVRYHVCYRPAVQCDLSLESFVQIGIYVCN